MSYEPLHHKYRPQTFAQLVGQEAIAATLSNAMIEERIAPAYLFTGPRGTGKTSSARILAKSLNCLRDKRPTPTPCGECETCREITRGSAMDIVEIDAASNTGVDNIREIIERAQFAPVRCRYKVYVIDECLTGDTQILTRQGSMRLDNPALEGKEVLSYNETQQSWEFKRVRRWLDRGEREIFSLKTRNRILQCTGNHLMRTATGWQEARSLQPGTQILSPAPTLASSDFHQPSSELAGIARARSQHLPPHRTLDAPVKTNTSPWKTTLEPLEGISPAGTARVYDLEVEDNHNFIANGLLVHNCHMLSTAAFNALLKTLEEPPPRVIFVLATTDPQRVLNTIISRCQRFDFRRIPLKEMVAHLTTIAEKESIEIEAEALTMVAQLAEGGLRDAESNLDRLSLLEGTITVERVWDLVGAIPERDLLELLRAIATDKAETVIDCCRHLMDRGREPLAVLQSLAGFYLNLLIANTSPQRSDLVSVTSATWEQLCQEAQRWETAAILHGQQHLKDSEPQIKNTVQPRLWLEVTLLGLLPSSRTLPTPQAAVASVPHSQTNGTAKNVSAPPAPAPVPEKRQEQALPTESVKPSAPPQPIPEAPVQPPREVVVAQSPAVTPPSESSTPQSAADLHQARVQEIWQRVLEAIVPPASQAFLRQKCQLLDFDLDDFIADVGVTSPNTLGLAESKRSNIEAAFERVWQQKVKVNLQIATESPVSRSVQPSPSPTPAPERRESSPPAVIAPAPSQPKMSTVLESPPVAKIATEQPAIAVRDRPTEALPQKSVETNGNSISSPPPATEEEVLEIEESEATSNDEVTQAALELAKLFDGEIINDNVLGNGVMGAAAIAPSVDESELESLPLAEEEEQEEEDDDIPF